jgi:hypothetical protein
VTYPADVLIGSDRFPAIQPAADDNDGDLVLGRNLLNKLALFLDGPQQVS